MSPILINSQLKCAWLWPLECTKIKSKLLVKIPQATSYLMIIEMLALSFTVSSQSKCAWPWPWPLDWANIKCKYTNWKPICDFQFIGNFNVFSISHCLRDNHEWIFQCSSKIFHLENDKNIDNLDVKLVDEFTMATCIRRLPNFVLLCSAICSQWHFVADIYHDGHKYVHTRSDRIYTIHIHLWNGVKTIKHKT